MFTFYNGTYWETFGYARNDEGVPMCGMQTAGDNNRFYVKWTPTNGMVVQVWKSNWRLANDTKVSFGLEFYDSDKGDSNTLSTEAGWARPSKGGVGTSLFMGVKTDDMATLLKMFGDAERVVISFPDGDEPSWGVHMDGSRKAANEFMHCMYTVQDSIKSAQPTSPVKPAETQPVKPASKRDDGSV
jgi:hypothetical protein